MNEDIIKENWERVKGKVQKKWGELTNDELDQIMATAKSSQIKFRKNKAEYKTRQNTRSRVRLNLLIALFGKREPE